MLVALAIQMGAAPLLHMALEPAVATATELTIEARVSAGDAAPSLAPPCDDPAHDHGLATPRYCALCSLAQSLHLDAVWSGWSGAEGAAIGFVPRRSDTMRSQPSERSMAPRAPPLLS